MADIPPAAVHSIDAIPVAEAMPWAGEDCGVLEAFPVACAVASDSIAPKLNPIVAFHGDEKGSGSGVGGGGSGVGGSKGARVTYAEIISAELCISSELQGASAAEADLVSGGYDANPSIAASSLRRTDGKIMLRVRVPNDTKPGTLLSVTMPTRGSGERAPVVGVRVPPGASPGNIFEVEVQYMSALESEVLSKMARWRQEAEDRVAREAEDYVYKPMPPGEYTYNNDGLSAEKEYEYGGS